MTRYLPRLFGGPLDGDTRVLDPHTRRGGSLVVPVRDSHRATPIEFASLPQGGSSYTAVAYRRHDLAVGSVAVEVWAHEGMPRDTLLARVWDHLLDRAGATYA